MPKILVEYEAEIPTVTIMRDFMAVLGQHCGFSYRFVLLKEITCEHIKWCDIYMSLRSNSPYSLYLQSVVKAAGRFYIAFHDDDLVALPKTERMLGMRRRSIVPQIKGANVLLSSNQGLIGKYSAELQNLRIVRSDTIVADAEISQKTIRKDDRIRIVFAAGRNHEMPFIQFIKPAINTLFERYGNRLEWNFIGVCPDMSDFPHIPIKYTGHMPLAEYRRYVEEQSYDIGVAPLDDTPFNNRKYFNKYIEYAMAGIPGIYSECLPYISVIRDGENGILSKNTPHAWEAAIARLVDSEQLRIDIMNSAEQDLRNNFSAEGISRKLLMEIPELGQYAAPQNTEIPSLWSHRMLYYGMRTLDMSHATVWYFMKSGPRTVIKKLKERAVK